MSSYFFYTLHHFYVLYLRFLYLINEGYRLEHSYPETKSIFTKLCENNDKEKESLCMNELIHDEFEEWHNELMNRLKKHM